MNTLTESQLKDDLDRILRFANDDKILEEMCQRCENWYGKDHDYKECIKEICFTFYRGYRYLDFANSFKIEENRIRGIFG